jgi:isopenicillin-N N-acyltransferase-like protein
MTMTDRRPRAPGKTASAGERTEAHGVISVPYLTVEVRGTNREIGRAVGEAARCEVRAAIGWYAEHLRDMANMEYSQALLKARRYLAVARIYLPQYVEELEGLAEGAAVPLEEIAVPNCGEEFACGAGGDDETSMRTSPGCTAIAIAQGGRHIVGHNMDWYSVDLDKNVLFDVTGPEGVRFLAFCGVPYLPALGMNSAGIGYAGNALYCSDDRSGIPNVLVRRWVLDSSTIAEACRRATHVRRARGSNHLFADVHDGIYNLETSGTASSLVCSRETYAHTNHYVHDDMLRYESSGSDNSRARLRQALTMLSEGLERETDPLELVMDVLRSHAGAAICEHPACDAECAESMTVGSMVCDLDNGCMYVCAGPPCRSPYAKHSL